MEEGSPGMDKSSVRESMHQLKLMHHITSSLSEGSDEPSTSFATFRKVRLEKVICFWIMLLLLLLLLFFLVECEM